MNNPIITAKRIVYVLLAIFLLAGVSSCNKETEFKRTKSVGVIQKQGITTYQYGTHVLLDGSGQTMYALRSERVNLDQYINQEVEVVGNLVLGYPVDGGPEYMDVAKVNKD